MTQRLFIFGLGYSALYYARHYGAQWHISGTTREPAKARLIGDMGIDCLCFGAAQSDPALLGKLSRADVLIISIPPGDDDPVLHHYAADIASHPPKRIVYLSTIGVYGNHDGAWVDEMTPPKPISARSYNRLRAEQAWQALGQKIGIEVDILRLAGIYGPERNVLEQLRSGQAKRIIKKGQVFNRIHVEDIARAIHACALGHHHGRIWNVGDDEPAPPQDVVAYGAQLIGCEPPPEIDFDSADLTPMARSFYSENKRVRNKAMREMLGVDLLYPNYRVGLESLAQSGGVRL
jgi:nucleoside-diphosphate-sugar epimerase